MGSRSNFGFLSVIVVLLSVVGKAPGQNPRQILGDIREQKISQVYDEDTREEKVYRRPPTYLIIASKIVRPSTIYQVIKNVNNKKPVKLQRKMVL